VSHIYVISAIEYVNHVEEGMTLVKIGFAQDVAQRLRMLQTGNPYEMTVFDCGLVKDAPSFEDFVHYTFRDYKEKNEWYLLPVDKLQMLYKQIDNVRQECVCKACIGYYGALSKHRKSGGWYFDEDEGTYRYRGRWTNILTGQSEEY
jgi:hypothetical protein